MAEYIVEFDKTQYDEMVADGILKEADNPTLYGMPVQGEIIRCRDCKIFETADCAVYRALRADGRIDEHGMFNPYGFCAWAERDA